MAFDKANHVVDGDVLCDTMLHPYHDWHGLFAAEYLKAYPEVASKYYVANTHEGELDSVAARKDLINDTYKGKTYHQEPLYTYLLAATFWNFGHDYEWVFLAIFIRGIDRYC
jgi:hypothetical protein